MKKRVIAIAFVFLAVCLILSLAVVSATATPSPSPSASATPSATPKPSPTPVASPSPKVECDDDIDCGFHPYARPERKCCDGKCKNTEHDEENCGACGTVCKQGQFCQKSVCAAPCELISYPGSEIIHPSPSTCSPTWLTCCSDGQCADINRDEQHCGSCGNKCKEGEFCYEGNCIVTECYPPCSRGSICCNKRCVDSSRNGNCGACDVTCKEGEVCDNGKCVTEAGCCQFEDKCEDREHPSECVFESGYINYWFGEKCSESPGCNTGCCFYWSLEEENSGTCEQKIKAFCVYSHGDFYEGQSCGGIERCNDRYGCCIWREGGLIYWQIISDKECAKKPGYSFLEGERCPEHFCEKSTIECPYKGNNFCDSVPHESKEGFKYVTGVYRYECDTSIKACREILVKECAYDCDPRTARCIPAPTPSATQVASATATPSYGKAVAALTPTKIEWSFASASDGDTAYLIALFGSDDYEGQEVEVSIEEKDLFSSTKVDTITAVIENGKVIVSWQAKWMEDGFLQGAPEYVAKVGKVTSNQLKVTKTPWGGTSASPTTSASPSPSPLDCPKCLSESNQVRSECTGKKCTDPNTFFPLPKPYGCDPSATPKPTASATQEKDKKPEPPACICDYKGICRENFLVTGKGQVAGKPNCLDEAVRLAWDDCVSQIGSSNIDVYFLEKTEEQSYCTVTIKCRKRTS